MKTSQQSSLTSGLSIPAFLIAVALALTSVSALGQSNRQPWRNQSQEQLSTVHWQWVLGSQVTHHPLFDATGADAFVNQPYFTAPGGPGQLLLLGGTFSVNQTANGDILGQATRKITIKQGTALFYPLLDAEWDNLLQSPHLGGMLNGHPTGVPVLKEIVSVSPDSAVDLFSTINGAPAGFSRLQSGPFSYRLPQTDNVLQSSGIDVTGTVAPAVSDGFFTFVPASKLVLGKNILRFGGAFPYNADGNLFIEDITYEITVIP